MAWSIREQPYLGFTIKKVYLFKGPTIGFNTGKASHIDNYWSYLR